jgi:succinate dehydrogenase / fumarate reductase cytochrome b subunit
MASTLTTKSATVTKPRPLSPHISIYAVQYTSTLSILHRLSGGFMCALILGFICVFQYFVYDWPSSIAIASELILLGGTPWLVSGLLGAVVVVSMLAFYYHFAAGSRHILFDIGLGFGRDLITFSGRSVILLALFLSITFFGVLFWSSLDTVYSDVCAAVSSSVSFESLGITEREIASVVVAYIKGLFNEIASVVVAYIKGLFNG